MKKHLHHILTLWLAMICVPNLQAQQQYVDITDLYIQNADFKKGLTGWTAQVDKDRWSNSTGKNPEVVEAYAGWNILSMKSYSLIQDINLPVGDYKLEAYAFYRQGGSFDTDKTKSLAYLIAGANKVLVKTLGSENANPYANDITQASAAFASGLYLNSLQFEVSGDDTSLKIGYEGTHDASFSWFITGPFKLYRAITAEEKYNLIKQEIKDVKSKLNPAWQEKIDQKINQAVTDYDAAIADLEKLQAEIDAFLPSYSEILSLYEENRELYDNTSETDNSHRQLFNDQINTAYNNLQSALTTAQLTNVQTALIEARTNFIVYAIPNSGQQLDFSFYTRDISFQITGWTKSYDCQNHVHKESTEKNTETLVVTSQEGFIENWNPSNFTGGDLSYTLTNLPMGVYTITAYTFDNVKSGKVAFFANESKVNLDASTDKFSLSRLDGVEVSADRTLKLGLRAEAGATNWMGISHIELFKTGNLPFSLDLWTEMKKVGKAIDQTLLPPTVANWLSTSLDKEPTGDEEADADALNELTNVVTLAQNIIQPYSDLRNKIAELKEIQTNSVANNQTVAENLQNSIMQANEQLSTISSVEDVNELTESLEEARRTYITNAQPNENYLFDMTYQLVNPTFDLGNINGWNVTDYTGEKNYPKFGAGSTEFWHCTFNLSQTITGLPNGNYTITAQIAATEPTSVSLNGNNKTAPGSTGFDLSQYDKLSPVADAFAADRDKYRSYVTATVIDGQLTLGIRNTSTTNWVVFDDFRLVYAGKNANSYYALLQEIIVKAEEVQANLKAPNVMMSTLTAQIEYAKGMNENSDVALLDMAAKNLKSTINQIENMQESYTAYLNIWNACQEYLDATEYSEDKMAFSDQCASINIEAGNAETVETINQCTEKLESARATFLASTPVVKAGQSLDVTFMVQNAACTAKDGWASDNTADNFNTQSNSSMNGEYSGTFLEKWNNSSSAPVFVKDDKIIYQTVNNLPQGIYELKAAAFRVNQNGEAAEYAMALVFNEGFTAVKSEVLDYYSVMGTVDENATAIIGLKALKDYNANWNAISDVTLRYLGNTTAAYHEMQNVLYEEATSAANEMNISNGMKNKLNSVAIMAEENMSLEVSAAHSAEMREAILNAQELSALYAAALAEKSEADILAKYSEGGERDIFMTNVNVAYQGIESSTNENDMQDATEALKKACQYYMLSGAMPTEGTYFDLSFVFDEQAWQTDMPLNSGENFREVNDNSVHTGDYSGPFWERYFSSDASLSASYGTRPLYKNVTNMPEGMYTFKAAAFGQRVWIGEAESDVNLSLFLNDRKVSLTYSNLHYTYIHDILHEGGDMTAGVFMEEGNVLNWIGIGDLQLYYYGRKSLGFFESTIYTAENDIKADVTLMTSNDTERWRTLCLPFDVDAATLNDQMEVREITGFETNGKDCILTLGRPVNGISAGKTYAVKMKNNTGSAVLNDVFIPAGVAPESAVLENNGVKAVIKGYFAPEELENECYTLYEEQDAFTVPSDHMAKAFQASLKLEGAADTYERILLSVDGIITSIDNAYHAGSEIDVYNVNGIMIKKGVQYENALKDLPKGIYIINGKKVMK